MTQPPYSYDSMFIQPFVSNTAFEIFCALQHADAQSSKIEPENFNG